MPAGARGRVENDDDSTRTVLLGALRDERYIAVGGEDGAKALALALVAEGIQPALIVPDARVPVLDGGAFLRAYRERHPQPVPVTATSPLPITADEAAALGGRRRVAQVTWLRRTAARGC